MGKKQQQQQTLLINVKCKHFWKTAGLTITSRDRPDWLHLS